ncbi:hypothetical protein [Actinomyces procaprae]|uniref:hypothetical protein n=1 Tax=Actinomyces procaprae TaxID=2560010 RepID=UPI0010A2A1FB|nr:hypothetical protein [Actinomyces procaprae]
MAAVDVQWPSGWGRGAGFTTSGSTVTYDGNPASNARRLTSPVLRLDEGSYIVSFQYTAEADCYLECYAYFYEGDTYVRSAWSTRERIYVTATSTPTTVEWQVPVAYQGSETGMKIIIQAMAGGVKGTIRAVTAREAPAWETPWRFAWWLDGAGWVRDSATQVTYDGTDYATAGAAQRRLYPQVMLPVPEGRYILTMEVKTTSVEKPSATAYYFSAGTYAMTRTANVAQVPPLPGGDTWTRWDIPYEVAYASGEGYARPLVVLPAGAVVSIRAVRILRTDIQDPQIALAWTGNWWVNAETTKTASTISSSTAQTTGTYGRWGSNTKPWPGGRTYRFSVVVEADADAPVSMSMGAYILTTGGAYARSIWPAGNNKSVEPGRRQVHSVDVVVDYRQGEGNLQLISYLRPGGSTLIVHQAIVQDITDLAAPTAPAGVRRPQMRAVAYSILGDRIGQLPDVLSMTATLPRNDTPTLSLSYAPEPAARGDLVERDIEIGVEVSWDGYAWFEPPGCRFITLSSSGNLLGDGTEARNLDAVHISHMLDEALVWEAPAAAQDADGKYNFLSVSAGTILRTVWDAAVRRGWGRGLTLDCTTARDSAGAAWTTVTTLAFEVSTTIGSVLGALTDLGMCDWRWEGRTLRVFNADTVLAGERAIVWPLAVGTTSAPESRSWQDLATDVIVKGEGHASWTYHNDEAPTSLRRIERVVEAGGVELESTARLSAQATLRAGATTAEEITREWSAFDAKWLPFADYTVGDWIQVQRASGNDRLQVAQVSLTWDGNGLSGHTTFGTVLADSLSRLAKRAKGIVGLASTGGNSTRPAATAAKRTPAVPAGLVARTTAWTTSYGSTVATMDATWTAVTTDTRGVALEGIEYQLRVAQVSGPPRIWSVGSSTAGSVEGLTAGEQYTVEVRAVATQEGTYSAWSSPYGFITSTDDTPPERPSKPAARNSLSVLVVTWDGRDYKGGNMPVDFSHLEVSVVAPGATPRATSRTYMPEDREVRITGLDYSTWEVRLRAFDFAGNASAWSDPVQAELEPLVDADAIQAQLDAMLPGLEERSAIYQRAAALVASGTAVADRLPPDEGVPGETLWIAPDGKVWRMKTHY